MNPSKLSATGENLLKSWEGYSLTAYLDGAGVPTIGWGHTHGVKMGDVISEEQAELYFEADIAPSEACVSNSVHVALSQHAYDALVIFTFNVGESAFETSTLLKALNAGNYAAVPEQMAQWRYITVNGQKQVSQGLVNRRAKEIALWAAPDDATAAAAPVSLIMTERQLDVPVPTAPAVKPRNTSIGAGAIVSVVTGGSGAIISGAQQANGVIQAFKSVLEGVAGAPQAFKLLAVVLAAASVGASAYIYLHKRSNLNGNVD